MTLGKLIENLDKLNEDLCIFARKPWSSGSEALVASLGPNFEVPDDISARGLAYFFSVHIAKQLLEVFDDRPASKNDRIRLLIYYGEHDAYPDWVFEE